MKTKIHRWVMIKLGDAPPVFRDINPLWWVADFAHKTVCFFSGHTPERDQCNNPDHDFCLWCGKSMPDSWTKPKEPAS